MLIEIFDRICQLINNTGRKPVMLNGVLVRPLRLILDFDANLDLGNPGLFLIGVLDLFLFPILSLQEMSKFGARND